VARTGAGIQRCGEGPAGIRRIGIPRRRERALGGIKFVNQNAVQAEIRDVNETDLCADGFDPVRVRCLLPFLFGPTAPESCTTAVVFAKLTVRKNGKDRDVFLNCSSRSTRTFPNGQTRCSTGLLPARQTIEQCQLAACRIERKRTDHTVFPGFVHGIEIFSVRWTATKDGSGDSAASSGAVILPVSGQTEGVNAFALGFCRVRPNVNEVWALRVRFLGRLRRRKEYQRGAQHRKSAKTLPCDFP